MSCCVPDPVHGLVGVRHASLCLCLCVPLQVPFLLPPPLAGVRACGSEAGGALLAMRGAHQGAGKQALERGWQWGGGRVQLTCARDGMDCVSFWCTAHVCCEGEDSSGDHHIASHRITSHRPADVNMTWCSRGSRYSPHYSHKMSANNVIYTGSVVYLKTHFISSHLISSHLISSHLISGVV